MGSDAPREVFHPLPPGIDLERPLMQLFDEVVERRAAAPLYDSRSHPRESCTLGEFARQARAVGRNLIRAGVQPGARVLLHCENRPRWAVAWAGVAYAGAVAVSLDAELGAQAVSAVAADSGASTALVSAALEPHAQPARDQGLLRDVFCLDEDLSGRRRAPGWSALLAPAPGIELPTPRGGDEPLAILYTSGTTGDPKGVVLTHRNLMAEGAAVESAVELRSDDALLMFLPMHHVLSLLGGFLMPALAGARVVHARIQTAEDLLEAIRQGGVTILLAVPLLFHRLHAGILAELDALPAPARALARGLLATNGLLRERLGLNAGRLLFRRVHRRLGPDLRLMVSGASALAPRAQRDLRRLGFTVAQAYGLTECTGGATFQGLGGRSLGSVGRPLAGVRLRIRRPDPEGIGEVLLSGPILMRGYHGRPAASAGVLREGWLHTGDRGWLDAAGELHLLGRGEEVIVLESGKNIYPEELEAHYGASPLIEELCVLGLERAEGGARVLHAVIVPAWERLREGGHASVRAALRLELTRSSAQLPAWQRVLSFEVRRRPLPRTGTRKLQRFQLRSELESTGAHDEPSAAGVEDPGALARLESPLGQRVAAVLQPRLEAPQSLAPSQHLELDLGLDSLRRAEVLMALESALGLEIREAEAAGVESLDDLLRLVEKRAGGAVAGADCPGSDRAPGDSTGWEDLRKPADPAQVPASLLEARGPLSSLSIAVLGGLARLFGRVLWRFEVRGRELLPRQGPFLICPNHASYLDGPLLLAALPLATARDSFALGRSLYVERGLFGAWLRSLGAVAVDTQGNLRRAMRLAAAGLGAGRTLVIFPEGTRSADGCLGPLGMGAPILASELNLPIVPVALLGTHAAWPRSRRLPRIARVQVVFGEAIRPEILCGPGEEGPARHARVAAALRSDLLALGCPAGSTDPRSGGQPL